MVIRQTTYGLPIGAPTSNSILAMTLSTFTRTIRKEEWLTLLTVSFLIFFFAVSIVFAGGGGGSGGSSDDGYPSCEAAPAAPSDDEGPAACGPGEGGGSDFGGNGGGEGSGQGGGGGSGGAGSPPPPSSPSFTAISSGGGAGGSGQSGANVSILQGGSATLSWSCVNSSSSSGVNFSTGGAGSGSTGVSPSSTTEYTVLCSNGGQGSVTVTVVDPTPSITATPSIIRVGDTSVIAWSATDVNSCSVSENNPDFTDSWSGASGSQTTSPITGETTYTLSCQTDAGSVSASATVRMIPSFEEF